MKLIIVTLASFALCHIAYAQSPASPQAQPAPKAGAPAAAPENVFNLTEEQQLKIMEIGKRLQEELKRIGESKLSQNDQSAAAKKAFEAAHKEIGAFLTPEQRAQVEAMAADARRKNGGKPLPIPVPTPKEPQKQTQPK